MNREIKFRFWDTHLKKMFTSENSNSYEVWDCVIDERFITQQYTGLMDNNGAKIYEGDVIKITFDTNYAEKPYYIGAVIYGADRGYPAYDLEPWIDCEMNALSWLKSEADESVKSYEVIGNIYENSYLIDR